MRSTSVAGRSGDSAQSAALPLFETWERAPLWARSVGVAGALLALGLLVGFYVVVAGAVHRAEAAREQARLDIERRAVCTAFTSAASRDLCAVTVATHLPSNALVPVAYEQRASPARKTQLTARLDGATRQLR